MERRLLGATGMAVSPLGFGGAEIGFEDPGLAAVERLLGAALDAGLNVIDTAECYSAGTEESASETRIGQAVGHRRDDFFLFTKLGHAALLPGEHWEPAVLRASIDRSLKRLRTDCVDLLQLHSCSEDLLRAGEVIEVLREARAAGKTRFIGYSGDSAPARYAVACGAFDTLQTSVNVADQECFDLTLPLCAERGMGVIAKRPIANAAFLFDAPRSDYSRPYWERLQALAYPWLKSADALRTALRFTLAAPAVGVAIVGTANPERWVSNAALLSEGPLPEAEFAAIRARWREVAGADWVGQV
jgi:aryl-alcohol dehydrogenase-like predicted oxidoreductase